MPTESSFRKNLCFYVYPTKGTSAWAFHINRLRSYWPIFNGKKVITIATDEQTVSVDQVKEALGYQDVIWRVVSNDKKLWETAVLPGMLECVESLFENEFTFYCHGKGAGYMDVAKKRWVDAMYFLNLSSPKLTHKLMSQFDAIGGFQFRGPYVGAAWHYSGTFFWFRHSALFAKNWRDIEPTNCGVEGYPGRHIPVDRSYSLIDPPNTQEFLQRWKPIIPDMEGVGPWSSPVADLRFTQIKNGMFHYMKSLLGSWGIDEEPRKDVVFIDFTFAADIMSAVSTEECHRLSELALGKRVLELGSQFGRSTIALASTASKVHAVDWHLGDGHAGMQDSLPEFVRNLDRYKMRDKIITHVGLHEEVLPYFAKETFDLAFIDSFHEGPAIERDLALVLPLMKPKGIVAFHDFGTTFPGVTSTVKAFADSRGASIETVGSLAVVKL